MSLKEVFARAAARVELQQEFLRASVEKNSTRRANMTREKLAFVAEIDPYELGARIVEAMQGLKRPTGMTARQAIEALDPQERDMALRGAEAAAIYLRDCIRSGQRLS